MKKILSIFCATAAIAFAASCAKEQYGSVSEGKLSKVTIAASFHETRTTITDTASVLWTKGDAVALFDSKGNSCNATVPEAFDGKTTADIEATLDATADNYYLVYPQAGASINGTSLTLTLASEQSSFADANAMAGTCKSSAKAITLKNLSSILSFETARTDIKSVAISGLTEDDAFPTQISLSFDENGRYTIGENLDAAEAITVTLNNKAGRYYAGFFPVEGISGLKLTLTTDNATEVITVNQTLNFSANKLINLGNIDSRAGKTYHSVKKVWTAADTTGVNALKQENFSGNIDEKGLFSFTASKGNAGTCPAFYTAKVDGVDKTAVLRLYQAPANNYGGFITLSSVQGDKIAGVKMSIGSNTTIAYAVDGDPVSIADSIQCTYSAGVNITSLNASTVSIYCVSTDKNRRLQIGSIEIVYAADPRTPQTLSFPEESYDAVIGQTFTAPKATGAQTTVSYMSSDNGVATVNASTGEVTVVGAGVCTITAIAAESDIYKSGTASYTLNVYASAQGGIKGIKELIRAGAGEEVSFKTSVTDMIVTFVRAGEYPYTAYLEESNGQAVYFYNTAANPFAAAGEKYNGTISGKGKVYNGACEITEINLSEATKSTGDVPLTTVTIAELNANYAAYEYRNVKIEGATAKSALTASGRSCSIAQGDKTTLLYTGVKGVATIDEGAVIDVVCHPDYYTKDGITTYQCYIWSQNDITVKGGANTVSGLPETKNLSVGDTWTIGATCTEGEVSYAITSGSEFASLSNGVLTANAAGTVVLKATSATSGIYTADEATCTITIAEAGSAINYTFTFTSAIKGWPTSKSTSAAGDYKYTLDNVDYIFNLSDNQGSTDGGIYCGSGYLMVYSNNSIGLPVISGKKLTEVSVKNSSGCSTSVKVSVTDGDAIVTGGTAQTWSAKSSTYTYSLSGTKVSTMYYLSVASKNAQIIEMTLTYE